MKQFLIFLFVITVSNTYIFSQNSLWSLPNHYYQSQTGQLAPLPLGPNPSLGDYQGQVATNCHNAMHDENGNLLFFIVDEFVYDAVGRIIDTLKFPKLTLKGTAEISIVPDPQNCSRYYIFSVGSIDYNDPFYPKLPYFTVINLEIPNIYHPNALGAIDYAYLLSILPNNLQFFANTISIEEITPGFLNTGAQNTGQGSVFIASSKLHSDNSRFVFISNGFGVYKYIINSTGFHWDGDYIPFGTSITNDFFFVNGEMELFEGGGEKYHYKIAVPYNSSSTVPGQNITSSLFIADLNAQGDVISNSIKYIHLINDNQNPTESRPFFHGVEFSSNGRYLYLTHNVNQFHPNPFEYVDLDNFNNGLIPLIVPNQNDYINSQIELGYSPSGDEVLYLTNGNTLATFSLVNSPNATNFNQSFIFPLSFNYPFNYQGYTSGHYGLKTFHLPDQIDGMNYFDHFNTFQCCFDDKFNYDTEEFIAQQSDTWEGGTFNNPFQVIGNVVVVKDEIIIPAGVTITIKDMIFKFSPKAKVVIERGTGALKGGRLILDGTTFTYDDNCAPDGFWFGVQVYGHETVPQSPLSNSQQGVLQMFNNSKIERAWKGVTLGRFNQHNAYPFSPSGPVAGFAGGVVTADKCSFIDNIQDIHFRPYTFQNINNRSFFRNCDFVTASQLNVTATFEHVWLNSVQGVFFLGNRFRNDHPEFYGVIQKGIGIAATNARFSVLPLCLTPVQFPINPCTNLQPNTFQTLRTGIRITSSNPLRTALIDKNEFIDNDFGVAIRAADFATITRNEFQVSKNVSPTTNAHAGVVVSNSRGYKIEENFFTDFNDPIITVPAETRGVVIQHSGETYNEVYNNTFKDIAIGVQAEGINGQLDPILISANGTPGLQIKCNTFIKNIYIGDIYVESGRIAKYQGFCATGYLANFFTSPAGNLFEQSNLSGDNDIEQALGVSSIRYYHHNTPEYIPLNYSITVDPFNCNLQFDPTKHCLSKINDGPFVGNKKDLITKKDSLGQLKEDLLSLVDGGNTQYLLDLIATGSNNQILNALLEASPFLSDEVLIAYLATNPPMGHINQVIQVNSPVSEDVMNALNGMGLPNGINNQINNVQTGVSEMEHLGAAISAVEHERNMIIDELIRGYIHDSLSVSPMDSIKLLLNDETIRTRREQICDANLMDDLLTDAETERQMIENEFGFDNYSRSITALLETYNYPTICDALKTDSLLFEEVESIAMDATDRVYSGRAEAMLCAALDSVIDPIVAPYWSLGNKSNITVQNTGTDKQQRLLNLYPNPTNIGTVTVELMNTTVENPTVTITNVTGQTVGEHTFSEGDSLLNMSVSGLKPGMYFIQLWSNHSLVENVKLIIH